MKLSYAKWYHWWLGLNAGRNGLPLLYMREQRQHWHNWQREQWARGWLEGAAHD